MAKLINVLAASIGGGLVLGAGLRMIDGASGRRSEKSESRDDDGLSMQQQRLVSRLEGIEARLSHLNSSSSFHSSSLHSSSGNSNSSGAEPDSTAAASLLTRLDAQRGEMEAIKTHVSATDRSVAEARDRGEKSDREIRKWTSDEIGRQIETAQARLQRDIDRSRRETLDALAEQVQDRVMQRIARLEDEVAGQSSAMAELRECSFKTEQSLQKLLEGIDRLVAAQSILRSAGSGAEASGPAPTRRWGIS